MVDTSGDGNAYPVANDAASMGPDLRTWMATHILAGMYANSDWVKSARDARGADRLDGSMATVAVEQADALLAELDRG